jgi:putative NADH-flavin reductase
MNAIPKFRTIKILIIGAAGGVGRHCVELALAKGHHVTAVLRDPGKLQLNHNNLKTVRGDVTEPTSFAEHLQGVDAAISTIGQSGGLFSDKPTTLYSRGAVNLLREAEKAQVPRAIFISAAGLEINPKNPFYIRLFLKYVIQKLLKHAYTDLHFMENFIKMSALNWTIVRPPQLTDNPMTGNYRSAINGFLDKSMKISRADVAHYIINHIGDETTYRATVEVAN